MSSLDTKSPVFSFNLFLEDLTSESKFLELVDFVLLLPLLVLFLGVSDFVYSSLKSTNSIIAMSALSPILFPSLIILVYPPGLSPTLLDIVLNNSLTLSLSRRYLKTILLLWVESFFVLVTSGSMNLLRALALVTVVFILLC